MNTRKDVAELLAVAEAILCHMQDKDLFSRYARIQGLQQELQAAVEAVKKEEGYYERA